MRFAPWIFERRPGRILLLLLVHAWVLLPIYGETWLMQSGEEYYGELESYSFQTREVILRKADGKPFAFPAGQLAFGAKSKLLFSTAFLRALPSYRPPLYPLLGFLAAFLMGILIPIYVGLVGSAHVLGTDATIVTHFRGFLKVSGLAFIMGVCWLIASTVLDPGVPVLPDTNADLVLALTSLNCGIIFCSFVVARHYRRSFLKGMAITLLTGVSCTILWTAGGLTLLFLATRRNLETVITQFVFEPLRWF
jgi:hypothetical protein